MIDLLARLRGTPGGSARDASRSRATRVALVALALFALTLSGCAYFNTFYYAKTKFREAFPRDRDAFVVGFRVTTDLVNNTQSASATNLQKAALDSTLLRCRKVMTIYRKSGLVDDAHLLAGKAYYGKGQYDRAIPMLTALLDSFPRSDLLPEATAYLGASYIQDNQVQRGRDLLEQLLVEHPKYKQRDLVSFILGISYRDDKRYDDAAAAFLDVVEHYKDSDVWNDAAFQAGFCLAKQRRWADARAAYDKVGRRKLAEDQRRDARMAIGDTYIQEKKWAEAERVYRALFNDLALPQTTDRDLASRARLRIAECRQGAGDYDAALQQLQNILDDIKALTVGQGSGALNNNVWAAEAQYDIGYILEVYKKDVTGARQAYAQVKQYGLDSQFATRAASRAGNLQRLTTLRAKKDKSDPAEQALSAAELLLFDLEKPADAVNQYDVVERRYPHSEFARKAAFAQGWTRLTALADTQGAIATFTRVLQSYPGSVYADDARNALRRIGITAPDSTPRPLDYLALARDSIAVVDSLRPFEALADSLARQDAIADSLAAAVQKAHDDSLAAVEAARNPSGGPNARDPRARHGRVTGDEDPAERAARERMLSHGAADDSLAPADSSRLAPPPLRAPRDSTGTPSDSSHVVPPDSLSRAPADTSAVKSPAAPPGGAKAPATPGAKKPTAGKATATKPKPPAPPPTRAARDTTATARPDTTGAAARDTTAADTTGAHR